MRDRGAGGRDIKISTRSKSLISFGDEDIDLSAVEMLVEKSQTRAIADALSLLGTWVAQRSRRSTVADLMQQLEADLNSKVQT